MGTWSLADAPGDMTRVEYRYETEGNMPSDRLTREPRLVEAQDRKAVRRLQSILEEDRDRGGRATVAGR